MLIAVTLGGLVFLAFRIHKDLVFSLAWYAILSSALTPFISRTLRPRDIFFYFIIIAALFASWMMVNNSVFALLEELINTNPYGDYVLANIDFRLSLSIFIMKFIITAWPTDVRILIVFVLLIANLLTFPRLKRYILSQIKQPYFEFVVYSHSVIKGHLRILFSKSASTAVLHGVLWGLAALLLKFDNYVLMMFVMMLCAFIPHYGLFVGGVLSLFFVESGLFLLQIGGLCIALASIWFVDHTIYKNKRPLTYRVPLWLNVGIIVLGYALFSFYGLFFSTILIYAGYIISDTISTNLALWH